MKDGSRIENGIAATLTSPPHLRLRTYQHDAQQHLLQVPKFTVLLQHAGSLAEESVAARELDGALGLA